MNDFDKLHHRNESNSIKWNSDFLGNYWDGYIGTDEDHNLIGDNFFDLSLESSLLQMLIFSSFFHLTNLVLHL